MLRAVLHALTLHPKVSRVWRANTGSGKLVRGSGASQWINFGFKGQPDVLGFTKTGQFLAVEVKAPGKKATAEQLEFLADLASAGGVAFVARSVEDVYAHMEFA